MADGDLLMALPRAGSGACLVRTDQSGRVLGCTLPSLAEWTGERAWQDAQALGDTVYALRTITRRGERVQALYAMPLKDTLLRPRMLVELPSLGPWGGWDTVYPEEECVYLTGIDREGQGWQLRWDAATGELSRERVLEKVRLYALRRVQADQYIWIDWDGKVGREAEGARQTDLLSGLSGTPCGIAIWDGGCFVSDSVTGDICQVDADGGAALFRRGEDLIGSTGYHFQQLNRFTAWGDQKEQVCIAGVCADPGGLGSAAAGENFAFSQLKTQGVRGALWWGCAWRAAVPIGVILAALAGLLMMMFCSSRLLVRLSACEIAGAVLLMAALTLVQLSSFQGHLREDAQEGLRLMAEGLAGNLSEGAELDGAVKTALASAGAEECAVSVYWLEPEGASVACSDQAPAGYMAEDVNGSDARAVWNAVLDGEGARSGEKFVYTASFTWGGRQGFVVASRSEASVLSKIEAFWQTMLPVLGACPVVFLLLILMTRRLLRPLDDIRQGLEEFATEGPGGTIPTEHMPKTELLGIALAFNELSLETRQHLNDRIKLEDAYARLVPGALNYMLGKKDVCSLSAGERAEWQGAALILLPRQGEDDGAALQALMEPAARHVQAHGGLLVGRDGGLGAVTAVFPRPSDARGCACDYLTGGGQAMAGVLTGRVELGVYGCDKMLYPMANARRLPRRQRALRLLESFGAVMVECGEDAAPSSPRLLGWDDGCAYYEDTSFRDSHWQTCWQDAAAIWEQAMEEFQTRQFPRAMRKFAHVLRLLPGTDGAASWYVFRCDALRGVSEREGDTWLLFDGGEEHGGPTP